MSTALPIVLEEDLATAPHLLIDVVKDASAAYQFGATEVLRTTIENRHGELHLHGAVSDASTQRNREVFDLESTASAGVLPIANAFAKDIDKHATEFSTRNERAFQIFTRALEAPNAAPRMQALNDAIGIDPEFGLAYTILAQLTAQTSPQSLPDLLAKAGSHASSFTALDRAKFYALAAQAVHAPISQQETALRTLLQLAPNNLDALAGLGSLRFLDGDLANGERFMTRALDLSPGNVNVLQQLARGFLETRQFAQAEKVLTGLDNNPAVLPALATCVLLEGDVRRASAISERFSESLQPAVQMIYRATWLSLSGNTAKAIGALEGQHSADPNLQSAMNAELVVWHLMQGDFAAAKQAVTSISGKPGAFTLQAVLLSRSDLPIEQWEGTVQSAQMTVEQKQRVLAYGLFLAGHYDRAAQIWQQAVNRSGGTDLLARAMLAGSLDRAGNSQAVGKVLVEPFVPEFGDLFAAVSFREMRRLLNLQVH